MGPGLRTKRRQGASAATYSLEMKAGAIMHAKTIKKSGSSFYPSFYIHSEVLIHTLNKPFSLSS